MSLLRDTTLHVREPPSILPTWHFMYSGFVLLSIDKSVFVLKKDYSPSFITKKPEAWKN